MNLRKSISAIFLTLTAGLFAVSLIIHVLLYVGFNTRDEFPVVWIYLQYAIVIGFIPNAVGYLSKRLGFTRHPPPYVWGSAKYEERSSLALYGEMVFGIAIVGLFLYALFNYIYWDEFRLYLWHPYITNGQYFAYNVKARVKTRSLTAAEYEVMSMYFARACSGHWMPCHLLAFALLNGGEAAPKPGTS